MNEPITNLECQADYNEPGSWGRMSEGWPETPYTPGKLLLCTKANVVPYGQYVTVGAVGPHPYDYSNAVIRVANPFLLTKLEQAYDEMFVRCRHMIEEELRWPAST